MNTLGLLIVLFVVLGGINAGIQTACEGGTLSINCGSRKVFIRRAIYGRTDSSICPSASIQTTNCEAASSVLKVKQACDGKHSCSVPASNNVFGDPCHGTFKYLRVFFDCVVETLTICENQKKTISCPSGKVLEISSAIYGRSDRRTCNLSYIRTTSCAASTSTSVVKASCNGRPTCTLYASNSVFQDPCPGTFKYLTVHFQCVVPSTEWRFICEDRIGIIDCQQKHIKIHEAVYGRTSTKTCIHSASSNTNCIDNVTSKVKNWCDGETICDVRVSNYHFGNPCHGTYKYLFIRYTCS